MIKEGPTFMTNKTIAFFPKLDNLIPPLPASSLLPEWYKKQSSYDDFGNPTIKRCLPIFDAMSFGYFLVAQSDVTVDSTNSAGLLVTADNDFNGALFSQHDFHQYDKYPIPSGYHNNVLRIDPMWCVQTPKDYSALFINPVNNGPGNISAITGLIDTDNFISNGHLSFFVKENIIFEIKKGTPIIQVLPIKRENWESKEMSTEESFIALRSQDNTGIMVGGEHQLGGYKKMFHMQKSFK